jgi:hypothetical protein
MVIAFVAVLVAAVAMAWTLASRRPEHRPVALLLSAGLVIEALRFVLDAAVLAPLRASLGVGVPWTGWARVAGVVEDALTLIGPAALVAAVLAVFTSRKPWMAAVGWALAFAFFVLMHPIAGDGSQARALLAVQALSSVLCAGIVAAWYGKASNRPQSEHLALALVVAAEVVSLLGAWTHGPFEHWPLSQMLYLTLFGVLVLVQGRQVWTSVQASS